MERARSGKSQSAMEFMTTYGWMMLVLAAVVSILYYLGYFNPNAYSPRLAPGGCQVTRPAGSVAELQGSCNNELPQFVGYFNSTSQYSWVTVDRVVLPNGQSSGTITAWINPQTVQGDGTYAGIVRIDGESCPGHGLLLSLQGSSGRPSMATWCNDYVPSGGPTVNYNEWNFVAVTVHGTTATLYVNGQSESGPLSSGDPMSLVSGVCAQNLSIGSTDCPGRMFYGMIADVQVYNTSLSSTDMNSIYMEGIGGPPIDLNYLVGWWPLNGNANDYSGNGYNGNSVVVAYRSSWVNVYTPP